MEQEVFYNKFISEKLDLKSEYKQWLQSGSSSRMFSWFNHRFLFSLSAKSKVVYIDAAIQMRDSVLSNLLQNPFLVLVVNRKDLVRDTFMQLILNSLPFYFVRSLCRFHSF